MNSVKNEGITMNPITLKIDDVQVTLNSIQKNKVYNCKCENYSIGCTLKQQLSTNHSSDALTATEVLFNVRNTTGEEWLVQLADWELVDTDGYAYKARALCDVLRPPRTLELVIKGSHITPGTQADFILIFPEFESDKEIACILFSGKKVLQAFEINEMKPEAHDLIEARLATLTEISHPSSRSRIIYRWMETLEDKIHSRLKSTQAKRDHLRLESNIKRIAHEIEQDLQYEKGSTKESLEERLRAAMTAYEAGLEELKAQEEEKENIDKKVEQLDQLSPRQFEEWVADLLQELGYEKVNLTPTSNDKGIDILAENKGSIIAVQCKKVKGNVGTPVVQAFLGAMQHAGAQRGLLVTTGIFNIGAEKMAFEHQIELIGRNELADLVKKALQRQKVIAQEQKHEQGYREHPQTPEEVSEWEPEQAWGEE